MLQSYIRKRKAENNYTPVKAKMCKRNTENEIHNAKIRKHIAKDRMQKADIRKRKAKSNNTSE